jgi:hypothetical protein
MKKNTALPVLVLALFGGARARADIGLLNLVNPGIQNTTPYSLSFVAVSTVTDVSFAGYQVPAVEDAEDISLTGSGPGNLLSQVWNFIPAQFGSFAGQYSDRYASGTNGLFFAGYSPGDYDTFEQAVVTGIGDRYTLSFLFTETGTGPSAFEVATPEPTALIPLTVLLGLAFVARKRNPRRAR